MCTDSTIPLPKTVKAVRKALLGWYDGHARDLPWRVLPKARLHGTKPDPYHVWLSEIMLQQTSVAAVQNYYAAFLRRWPTVENLAHAPLEEVLAAWAGLGYYARARNLHQCARTVMDQCDGHFPQTEKALRALPGIGDYTAAAMAAILYEAPTNVVDGNIERVMARLHRLEAPLPRAKTTLKAIAAHYVASARAADWPQALMDLGATVCRPKNPDCARCPLKNCCAARTENPADYPRRSKKAQRPVRYGTAFVLHQDGKVLLRRRPAKGLLGAMSEVPNSAWDEIKTPAGDVLCAAPCKADWRLAGTVRHGFSHFELRLDVYQAQAPKSLPARDSWWASKDALDSEALPSVMRKVLALGLMAPK